MSGSMKSIYLDVSRFVQNGKHNFSDVEGDEVRQIEAVLADVNCYKGNSIQQAKSLMQAVQKKVADKLHAEKELAGIKINGFQQQLKSMSEFSALSDAQKDELLEPFTRIQLQVDSQSLIGMVRDDLRRFEQDVYPNLLSRVITLAEPEPVKPQPTVPQSNITNTSSPEVAEPEPVSSPKKVEVVNVYSLKVASDKPLLTSDKDVDVYIEQLRMVMLQEIASGKRVKV